VVPTWENPLSAEVLAYYPMEGSTTNLLDYSGNFFDGTNMPSVALGPVIVISSTNVNDRVEHVARLDGSDDGFYLPPLDITGSVARTVMAWIKPDLAHGNTSFNIASWGTASAGRAFLLYWDVNVNSNLYWSGFNRAHHTAQGTVPAGVWSHVAVTYAAGGLMSSTNALILYVNAVRMPVTVTGSSTGPCNTSDERYAVGVRIGPAFHFDGWLDEPNFYLGTNLTREEIRIQMSNTCPVLGRADCYPGGNIQVRER
jgi:hypothetical protein